MRAYADTPFGQVHYRVAGEPTARPLLLIHGTAFSSQFWDPVLPLFATRGYYAVAPDLIGCGESDSPSPAPTLHDYAGSVIALINALGLTVIDVFGYHSGSSVACLLACEWTDRVRRLALWGVTLMANPVLQSMTTTGTTAPDWNTFPEWIGAWWNHRKAMCGEYWSSDVGRDLVISFCQAGSHSNALRAAGFQTPVDGLLPRIWHPLLAFEGEADALHDATVQAARLAPAGIFQTLPGSMWACFDPELLVGIVDRFLSRSE
jgi:pimeloyl-ACP methyl ester carboxylesterase